jgi:VanZ family protein
VLELARGKAAFLQWTCRIAAWPLGFGLALLHVVPATHRPVTVIGHGLEHVGVFLLLGLAFGLGYPRRLWAVLRGLVVYCLTVEAIQIAVPGRHARLSDLLINAASALMGVAIAVVLVRVWERWREER